MINFETLSTIWLVAIAVILVMVWFWVTVGCAMGQYGKVFRRLWLAINIIGFIAISVIVSIE